MKNLRLPIWTAVLIVGFGLVTPVLPQSGCGCNDPGQTSTPPCASAQMVTDDPDQIETPRASNTLNIASTVEEALVAFLVF